MAISLAGVLTLERLSADLNRRLLSKELDTVIADVAAAHRVLVESGCDIGAKLRAQRPGGNALRAWRRESPDGSRQPDPSSPCRARLMRDTPSGKGEDILDHLPRVAQTDGVTARADTPGANLHFFRVIPEWNWMVVLSASTQEMRTLRTAFLRNALIILAVSLIAGGLILVALTRSVVGPIQILAKAAMGLSRGAFDAQLPTVKTNDEVAGTDGRFRSDARQPRRRALDLECQTKELLAANANLNQEVAERKKAEKQLEEINRDLEGLVEKRTRALARQAEELAAANRKLA